MTDETPRTDAATVLTCPSAHFENGEGEPMVPMETARQLERELATATTELAEAREALRVMINAIGDSRQHAAAVALARAALAGKRP